MNKYEQFLKYFDYLVQNCKEPVIIPDEVKEVYESISLQSSIQNNKPLFTETGLQILEYLQKANTKNLKAKDIAEGMVTSSRQISGAIRKLVNDGYVSKIGQNPVIYSLTEKGINFNIEEYKEKNNNEKDND